MEGLKKSYDDTMHQLFIEQHKSPRNESLIIKLKVKHEETANLLSEMSLGTPILSGLKAKLDKFERGDNAQGVDYYYRYSGKET